MTFESKPVEIVGTLGALFQEAEDVRMVRKDPRKVAEAEAEHIKETNRSYLAAAAVCRTITESVTVLEDAYASYEQGEWAKLDAATLAITEQALSVEVRSGWVPPGDTGFDPVEFAILLSTGGPAVRMRGDIELNGEVGRVWIEHQDWFTNWETYYAADMPTQEVLQAYANCFALI